jgi:hypothetical protein
MKNKKEGNEKPSYRQGDILFEPIDSRPSWAMPVQNNIVKAGESGNQHWFDSTEQVVFQDGRGSIYVELVEETVLIHSKPDKGAVHTKEEARTKDAHIALKLPRGAYKVRDERDQNPFLYRTNDVAD